ncbi:MAG: hypothetical protein DLM59_10530 [Pseudonocardiales bacterium]|nr:MAG: hypothetical protein DLM59_10530 [Pseudonocardiales bacterium]
MDSSYAGLIGAPELSVAARTLPPMTTSFDDLSDEQMADEITTWAGRIASGEAHPVVVAARDGPEGRP